ncbi:MAG: hypothetical protein J6A75_01430 [Lachnospiraceae bacterium]|nr:hypothetical protein [Lachnospiraceae bacterium]
MRKRTPYETGGFAFSDEKMMEKAAKEMEAVSFARNKIDMQNPESVLQIYCQMIERQLFKTPVGYAFLYELQEYLKTSSVIDLEVIPSIPIVEVYETAKEEPKDKKPREKRTKAVHETKVQNVDYKKRFHTSFSINILLILTVIAMFIVAGTSDNINILNYENALIEKYEMWEQELEEREEALNK